MSDLPVKPPQKWVPRIAGTTIADYRLIQAGDRILLGLSGGKDSWVLMHLLQHLQRVSPIRFELHALTVDPGFDGFDTRIIQQHAARFQVPFTLLSTRIVDTIETKNSRGKNPCAFCARLRRGAMYRFAVAEGFNKIALGHHADDAIETMLLSGLWEGKLSAIPPVLKVHQQPLTVIRPLIRVFEDDIVDYFSHLDLPQVTCPRDPTDSRRKTVKKLLDDIQSMHPGIRKSLLASLQQVQVSHFLDRRWL